MLNWAAERIYEYEAGGTLPTGTHVCVTAHDDEGGIVQEFKGALPAPLLREIGSSGLLPDAASAMEVADAVMRAFACDRDSTRRAHGARTPDPP